MYGKEVMKIMEGHSTEDAWDYPEVEDLKDFPGYEYYNPDDIKVKFYKPIYEEDPVVATNIVRLRKRSAEGMKKYGTTMMRDDLTEEDWIDHAIEEALDFANYLEALKRKIARSRMGGSD